MTTRESLLRSILEHPEDDLPRLVLADWLDEAGEPDRAEFIRVQVELARTNPAITHLVSVMPRHDWDATEYARVKELRRRERELKTPRNMAKWFPAVPILGAEPFRGFIDSITCSWADWLRHHEVLFWSSRQTVECPKKCVDGVNRIAFTGGVPVECVHGRDVCPECDQCKTCSGTGRIEQSIAATAQPLRELRLTDWPSARIPYEEADAGVGRVYSYFVLVGDRDCKMSRVKCPTCDGSGGVDSGGSEPWGAAINLPCPDCYGTPLNRWTCDEWPGLEVVMPEST